MRRVPSGHATLIGLESSPGPTSTTCLDLTTHTCAPGTGAKQISVPTGLFSDPHVLAAKTEHLAKSHSNPIAIARFQNQ